MTKHLKRIIILGRPNVGKSTLFNRLVGQKAAIVHDMPGVTRDVQEVEATLGKGVKAMFLDTAGLEEAFDHSLSARMRQKTEDALTFADIALLVIDAREGITPLDQHYANWLRQHKKTIILIANKAEGNKGKLMATEAYQLGIGEPLPVSAEHNEGIRELKEKLIAEIGLPSDDDENDAADAEEIKNRPIKITILGQPNAGKSTLLNALIGEDKLLTGPEAGITRDAITVPFSFKGRALELIDTAGLRKKSKVVNTLEQMSVQDSLEALKFSEITILVIDALETLEKQDLALATHAESEGRALIIAVNKWDAVENNKETWQRVQDRIQLSLGQIKGIEVVKVSALKRQGLDEMMKAVFKIHDRWNTKVKTADLNRWLDMALQEHQPPLVDGRRLKIKYITQTKARPPTFYLSCNMAPKEFPGSYLRYLANSLREHFDMEGVPLRLNLKQPKNPYEGKPRGERKKKPNTIPKHRLKK